MSRLHLRPNRHSCPVLVAVLLFATAAASAEDATIGRLLASQCAQCHGTDGYAVGDIDELAGEEAKDLFEDLVDMRGEDYPENMMDHQALGYSEDQIRRMAAYFATLPENLEEAAGRDEEDGYDQDKEHEDDDDEREDERS